MARIRADQLTDEALRSYDDWMRTCTLRVERVSPLAAEIWADVLRELGNRGKIRLISGSYDNVASALIQRFEA